MVKSAPRQSLVTLIAQSRPVPSGPGVAHDAPQQVVVIEQGKPFEDSSKNKLSWPK
jgi:hypothetical protein